MNKNVAALLFEQAKIRPESLAIITNQYVISYGQLKQWVGILVHHLKTQGVEPGQVVGVSMAQNPFHLITILALAQMGAVSLPLHQAIPKERRLLAAKRFEASWVVSGRNEFALEGLGFIGLDTVSFDEGSKGDDFLYPANDDTPMRIVISSGTSGDPKGMILTHKLMALRNQTIEAEASSLSRVISMDLNFIVGFRPAMSALARGAALVMPPSLDVEDILQSLITHRVTHAYFSPIQAKNIAMLVNAPVPMCPDIVCLRIGGGFISAELLQAINSKLSQNIYASYGSTESGLVTYATPTMLANYPGTVGKVCEWATVEIVNDESVPLPPGMTGLIRVRSSHQVNGYYHDEERTQRFFRDEWFYPGDLGYFDSEGLLYIAGRIDERINLGGMIIYPDDIEAVLVAHPGVRDAGVFVASKDGGNEILAVALVLDNSSLLSEIQIYAIAKLGPLAPSIFFTAPVLPRTETGKLIRGELVKAGMQN